MICEHRDREVRGGLIPADGRGRDRVLMAQGLADDVTDAAFALLIEQRRPASEQSAHSAERWRSAILRGVAAIAISGTGDEPADLGEIATAVAIDYVVPPARHRLARCRPCHRGVECGGNAMARDGRDRDAQGVTRMQTLGMWMAWAALAGADIPVINGGSATTSRASPTIVSAGSKSCCLGIIAAQTISIRGTAACTFIMIQPRLPAI